MKRLHKILHLSLRDFALLGSAWLLTLATVCLVWLCSIPRTRRVLRGLMLFYPRIGAVTAQRIAWAVEGAARIAPGATCLVSALAGQALLNRYSHSATLCIGAVRNDRGGLDAHAWLEDRGDVLIGGPAPRVSGFAPFTGIDELTL